MGKDSKFFSLQVQLISEGDKGHNNFHMVPDIA